MANRAVADTANCGGYLPGHDMRPSAVLRPSVGLDGTSPVLVIAMQAIRGDGMKKRYVVAAIVAAMSTSALADKFFAVTPSGSPETLFPDKPGVVIGELSSKCIDAHWTVTSSTGNELVCEAPMSFGQSLLGTLAMGNSYSTPPRRFFRFNIAEINGISRVQASGWMELQMAFGQVRRTDFVGPEFHNSIMGFMTATGGHFPPGTTFPNHVVMGINIAPTANGVGFRVTSVEPGYAAAKAGMQVDDVVVAVAKKRFKNDAQYMDAIAKAAETPTYEVEVIRAGKSMKLAFDRDFRLAVTEQVVAKAEAPVAAVQTVAATTSVADELSKLSALKDKGIITADEFTAQKHKLLGN